MNISKPEVHVRFTSCSLGGDNIVKGGRESIAFSESAAKVLAPKGGRLFLARQIIVSYFDEKLAKSKPRKILRHSITEFVKAIVIPPIGSLEFISDSYIMAKYSRPTIKNPFLEVRAIPEKRTRVISCLFKKIGKR